MSNNRDNIIDVLTTLFKELRIKFTSKYLKLSVLSHPNYPSLLSISDTLKKYKIDSLPLKLGQEKLKELPLPCVLQLSDKGGMFYVLDTYTEKNSTIINEKGRKIIISSLDLINRWTGVCLLVETNQNSGEPDIEKKLASNKIILGSSWLLALLFLISFLFNLIISPFDSNLKTLFFLVYTIIKLLGLAICTLILWNEVDKGNPIFEKFCPGGLKVDCKTVLESKYSNFFHGTLSFGLIGFSYFFASIFLLSISESSSILSSLAFMSFFALLIFPFSIYYQGFVLKKWCWYCIIILFIILFEAMIAYFDDYYLINFNPRYIPLLIGLLVLPIPIWKRIKALLEKEKELFFKKSAYLRLKNNPDIFFYSLNKSRKIINSTEGMGISFDNPSAKYNVIKVCNPYCNPCAEAHPIIEKLFEEEKINLQILFTSSSIENDARAIPVSHFLALEEKKTKNEVRKALNDWYTSDKKNYGVYSEKHPVNYKFFEQKEKIKSMRDWCDKEKITHTPTIFINGFELPKEYNVDDLTNLLL